MTFSSLKIIPASYIKITSVLSRSSLTRPLYFFRTSASLRDITKAFLITRTYQSSPETITVEFNDALSTNLHYAWLRDSCRCSNCVHPKSQQKLFDTTSLKLNITPRFCHVTDKGQLKIVWFEENGDHVSLYDPFWLHRYALGFENDLYEMVHDTIPPVESWTKRKLEENLPEVEYDDIMQSPTCLHLLLQNLHKYGIIFMRNVPCLPGEVVKVMNRIANIKQTRWGSSFHITTDETFRNPTCITQAEKSIDLHTDMDYLEKSPGVQATHCLELHRNSRSTVPMALPDQSYFVDGFYVAEWLKKNYPVYFNTLSSVPVKFRLLTQNMEYLNYQPILRLNTSRVVSEVHFNTRLMTPLEGPSNSVPDFYAAFKVFGENIHNPSNIYSFSFQPGDMVILNNRRVLHGGYPLHFSKVEMHLEGCFADLDEVLARYRSFLMKKRVNSER